MKRRLIRYLVIGFMCLVLAGLWAFSYLFFNPFEGNYEYDLSSLIPREVDFYVSKADLAGDFDPLPRPAFAEDLEANAHGQALLELDFVKDLLDEIDVQEAMAELGAGLAELPIRQDPLEIFGGNDLALAGNLAGEDLSTADWALYGRVNWIGKLGLELLNSGLVSLDAQGLSRTKLARGVSISGARLVRPLYLTRIRDVVVVATREEFIDQAHEFDERRGENSFGLSAKYADHIAQLAEGEDDLEAYVDWRSLSEKLRLPGTWPDPRAQDFAVRLAARLFQVGALREAFGRMSFGNGLTFDLSGELSSELVSTEQKRIYREKGFEKAEIKEFGSLAPGDVGFFVCARMPVRDLLTELVAALDEPTRGLIEDKVRDVWGQPDLSALLEDLSGAFQDRFALFLRDNDYPEDTGADAPLHDDAPTSAWALALLVDDQEVVEELRAHIHANPGAFGIAGRDRDKGGIFYNEVAGGALIIEYHVATVPGTGLIATLEAPGRAGNYFLLGNSHRLLGQVNLAYLGKGVPSLAEDSWFETLVNTGLPSADVVVWSNPRAINATTHAVARREAELDLPLRIDWDVERPRIEARVKKEQFSGGIDSTEDQQNFELAVQTEVDRFQREFAGEHLPALQASYVRPYDALELMSRGLFELTLDPKSVRLHGRIVVDFDEDAAAAEP